MKRFLVNLLLLAVFVGLTLNGYASGMLSPDEMDAIDKIIAFLESIDLNGIHLAVAALLTAAIMVLKLFKKRIDKKKARE